MHARQDNACGKIMQADKRAKTGLPRQQKMRFFKQQPRAMVLPKDVSLG
jgi:hypothetical protein